MADKMLIINPGSTSTKTALFDGERRLAEEVVRHDAAELAGFENVTDQFDCRMATINKWIEALDIAPGDIKVVVGRGAPLRPVEAGSFEITDAMLNDLRSMKYSNHASNLGALIAHHLGRQYGVPSLITEPITVDTFTDLARISGVPEITRKCRVHGLNIKEICRRQARALNKQFEHVNFVAVHMGGGISVAAVEKGRVIDVNDALLGMGPFSPDRAGALPIGGLVKLCYSGKFTEEELIDKLSRKSGLMAYLGSADLREVEKMIESGNDKAKLYFDAMAYQIAKEIGAVATVLKGRFEAILLTGGMANSVRLVNDIKSYVSFLGEVVVMPGEYEMEALAAAGLRFLRGMDKLIKY